MVRRALHPLVVAAPLALGACASPAGGPQPAGGAGVAGASVADPSVAQSSAAPAGASPVAPSGEWSALATSREGRALRHLVLGSGPRRVVWVGGIHGDEREGARATAELAAAFLAEPGAAERVTLLVIEDLNPDGSARGTRGNARGVDLNRNFPAASHRPSRRGGGEPLSEPESRALFELVVSWRPELVLVAHSWRGARFVNYDGPARAEAERFAERSGLALRESKEMAPTPGSLGSWAEERGLALLTLEYRRGEDPLAAWESTRAAILAAILGE